MSDRPADPRPPSSSTPPRATGPEDAVFEDILLPGDGAATSLPSWETLDPPTPTPAPAPKIEIVDGLAGGDGQEFDTPDYTPGEGFRIDFDAEPEATTALTPVAKPFPKRRPSTGSVLVPPPPPPPAPPRAEARRSAIDKARMLRRYKWLILGLTLLGLGLGWLYSTLTPPIYKAHSLLLIDPTSGDGAGGVGSAPGAETSRVLNQALVLQQAPQIAEETASALLGRPEASAFTTLDAAADRYGEPLTTQSLADYLQEEVVTVEPAADEADAIRVEATAEGAEEAALIAQLYTDEYTSLTRSALRERSTRTREALDEEIARTEGELDEIEQQLERYMTSQNAAGLDEQTRVTVSQIGQLQASLDIARVEAQTHRARLEQLRADLATVPERLERSAEIPSTVETTDLDTEIARIERLLEQIYTQNPDLRGDPTSHPDVANLDRRLRSLRSDRRQRIGSQTDAAVAAGGLSLSSGDANGQAYLASLRTQISSVAADLAGAEARAATLASRLGDARSQLRAVPGQRVELDQLERQREASAATLRQLQAEADRTSLAETTEMGFAQVIREVRVPREPAGPGLPANLAVGGILGFLLGLGLAFVRHQTDSRIRTPDDLREHGFAVIGTIPDLTKALRGERVEVEGAMVHPGLVGLTSPFGPEAEAFRHVHAALYAGGHSPQVVLVGAPGSHAGKSLVASNLAIAAAQAGRRTLLVDANLRHPAAGALFGLGDRPLGEGPEGSNFVYWSTAAPGLFAMTPREIAQRPDQMWAPDQIGELLQNLRDAFDLVIIDTPAALGSATATLLAPHTDAALLLAEADRTDIDAMTQVATELTQVGLTRVGAVLNRFDARGAVGFRSTAAVRHAA